MLTEAIKARLRDPEYLELHMLAVSAIRQVGQVKWYDDDFLTRFEAAKIVLSQAQPDALEAFVAGFAPLHPPKDQQIKIVDDFFDQPVRDRVLEIVKEMPEDILEGHELEGFGRSIVHNHPFFLELQRTLLPVVSELAGCELEPSYTFLSLYGPDGVCGLHMDKPKSMYTLDYCIDQSDEWPIYFSDIVDWPEASDIAEWSEDKVLSDPDLTFTGHALKPNQALLFTGSSQWHYRRPIQPGGWCNLLFLHYYPKGCDGLVHVDQWADHFDLPALKPLCDIFEALDTHGDGK